MNGRIETALATGATSDIGCALSPEFTAASGEARIPNGSSGSLSPRRSCWPASAIGTVRRRNRRLGTHHARPRHAGAATIRRSVEEATGNSVLTTSTLIPEAPPPAVAHPTARGESHYPGAAPKSVAGRWTSMAGPGSEAGRLIVFDRLDRHRGRALIRLHPGGGRR